MTARTRLLLPAVSAALALLCALAACSDETGAEEKREPVEASVVLGKTEISDFSEFRVECAVKGKAAGDTVKLSFELPEGFSLRYAADDDPFDPELGGTLRDSDKVVLSDELHLVLLDTLDVIVSILVVKPEKKPSSSAKGSSEKGSSGSGSSEEGGSSGEGGSSDSGSSVEESSGSSEALSSSEEPSSSSEAGPEPQLPGWTAAAWGTTSNAMKTAKDNRNWSQTGDLYEGSANAQISADRIVLTTVAVQKCHYVFTFCTDKNKSTRNSTGLLFTGSISAGDAEAMYDASGSASDFKGILSFSGVPFGGKPDAFEIDYVYEHVAAGDQRGLVYVLLLNGTTIVGSGARELTAAGAQQGLQVPIVYGDGAWYDASLLVPAGLQRGTGSEEVTSAVALFASSGTGAGSVGAGSALTVTSFRMVYGGP